MGSKAAPHETVRQARNHLNGVKAPRSGPTRIAVTLDPISLT